MRKVLVTGGAGFLGRGILRQVAQGQLDWDVTVYSTDEEKQDKCKRRFPDAHYVLGDVRDLERLRTVMKGHEWVVHAAAIKYIPEAELNVADCVAINVDGARNVMTAAKAAGVGRVVGISTDKAVQPVNVYGMTKAILERLFQEEQQYQGDTAFTCVRYGNVVGSTGSVVPLFRRQAAEGRVLITDPQMTRFWMGVDEAVKVIVVALTEVPSGSIVIPPVRAMSLVDVAKAATREDIPVEVVGMRPGEKQHEMLLHYQESVRTQRRNGYIELLPPGGPSGSEPFTIASHTPQHLISPVEMRELIADAEEV